MVTLEHYQEGAAAFLTRHRRALVQSPAGSGKTIVAAAALDRVLAAKPRTGKVVVGWIANTNEQCQQARDAIAKFPELEAAIEAIIACPAGVQEGATFDVLIVDEAHHAPAPTWDAIITAHRGALWLFTATPFGEDLERNRRLREMVEDNIHVVPRAAVADRVLPGRVILLSATDIFLKDRIDLAIAATIEKRRKFSQLSYGDLYQQVAFQVCMELGILPNRRRNAAIVNTAIAHAQDSTLILVHTIAHGTDILQPAIPGSVAVFSKMGAKKRRDAIEGFKSGEIKTMIATSLADEGLDVPIASVLIMAQAGRSNAKTEQRAGRVLRAYPGKREGLIYDFTDEQHPLLANQSRKRQTVYQSLGYRITRPQ